MIMNESSGGDNESSDGVDELPTSNNNNHNHNNNNNKSKNEKSNHNNNNNNKSKNTNKNSSNGSQGNSSVECSGNFGRNVSRNNYKQ